MERSASDHSPNDGPATVLVNGTFDLTGEQPFSSNSFGMIGVTGGLKAGFNWQVDSKWLLGIETNFDGSGLKGGGSSTTLLHTGPIFTQTITVNE
jgi:outer membrane immunogenic protein